MTSLNSTTFYKTWLQVVNNRKNNLLTIWSNPKEFTLQIKNHETSVLQEIAAKFELKCITADYYSLDAILYDDNDLVPDHDKWVRNIQVAFEHENDFNSGLFKEVSHLLIINSNLRVLVSYPNKNEQSELLYLHNLIRGSKQSKTISENESFLLILGYEKDFFWKGYIYKEDNWMLLGNEQPMQ